MYSPDLSKNSGGCMLSRAHSGDAHEAPPEAIIKTPLLITSLLGKENQTDRKKIFQKWLKNIRMGSPC